MADKAMLSLSRTVIRAFNTQAQTAEEYISGPI